MNFNSFFEKDGSNFYQKFLKYQTKYNLLEQFGNGESNAINLTNITPTFPKEDKDGIVVYADYKDYKNKKFSPMFVNPLNAKKLSPTNSTHLVVPGLMPAHNKTWLKYPNDKIFYMPNDLKPHFHGEAQHHMKDMKGFEIDQIFSVKKKGSVSVENKKLINFRKKLNGFNNGESSTPVETWIHWMIPYNQEEYPKLIVKKNSIIWWDYNNHHNLNFVSEKSYNENKVDDNDILLPNEKKKLQVKVTIMDKVGNFYFLCSVPGHAEVGHKIKIEVIE